MLKRLQSFGSVFMVLLLLILPLILIVGNEQTTILSSPGKTVKAILEVHKFQFYELDKKGVKVEILGDRGYHYGSKDEAFSVTASRVDDKFLESLKTQSLISKGSYAYFSSTLYERNDSLSLKSSDSIYDKQRKLFIGENGFTLVYKNALASGESFAYSPDEKKLSAKSIKVKYNF